MKYTVKRAKSCGILTTTALNFTLLTFICLPSAAGVLPPTAKLVPPETALLINIDDFSRLKTSFEKTNFYKLYKDPAMAAFIANAKAKWQEKVGQTDNEVVKAVINTDLQPTGRAVFALVLNKRAADANEPQALFITQWGEKISQIRETVDKTVKKAVEEGCGKKKEDYRGISIETIIGKDSERLGLGFSSELSYCFADDCLIASEDIEILKFVIAHTKSATSPTLAGDADYSAAIGAVGGAGDIDLYVNIKHIIKTVLAKDTTGKTKTTITNLGVDNVSAFACSIGLASLPGSSSIGKAILKIDGAKKGICKMLDMESAALKAGRFISASAYSATFLNLNIKKAYSELSTILTGFSPQAAAMMYMPLLPPSPDGQPGLQLKNDIIDHLGSQIIIAKAANKPFSTNSAPTESLVALAVENRSALEKSLSRLHSTVIAANNPDASRQLLGHTIYLVNLSGMMPPFQPGEKTPMEGGVGPAVPQPQMPVMAFTITDTHLILGVEPAVERAVRTLSSIGTATLASAKWFNSAKSAIPSAVGMAALGDNAASAEVAWWAMKEFGKMGTSPVSPAAASIKLGPQQLGALADFSLLPEFDAVRKYFGVAALYGVSRADGLFFEFKYLNPAGTD